MRAEIRESPCFFVRKIKLIYRGTERGVKAGNGCSCAKGCDTVLFLPGNFGGEDDGDTKEIRIIPTGSCVLVYVRVTIYSILLAGNAMETLKIALDENGKLQYLFRLSGGKLYRERKDVPV